MPIYCYTGEKYVSNISWKNVTYKRSSIGMPDVVWLVIKIIQWSKNLKWRGFIICIRRWERWEHSESLAQPAAVTYTWFIQVSQERWDSFEKAIRLLFSSSDTSEMARSHIINIDRWEHQCLLSFEPRRWETSSGLNHGAFRSLGAVAFTYTWLIQVQQERWESFQ